MEGRQGCRQEARHKKLAQELVEGTGDWQMEQGRVREGKECAREVAIQTSATHLRSHNS